MIAQPKQIERILTEIESEYQALVQLAENLPPEQASSRPNSTWSAIDVAVHNCGLAE